MTEIVSHGRFGFPDNFNCGRVPNKYICLSNIGKRHQEITDFPASTIRKTRERRHRLCLLSDLDTAAAEAHWSVK